MSISNGTTGDSNGLKWTVGLLNSQYKYLTAEMFGCKVNTNGVALKKKQLWSLEPYTGDSEDEAVCLKSHLKKYLAVDQFGDVTCDSEELTQYAKFRVVVNEDGRWTLINSTRGYFLGAIDGKLICSAETPGENELWTVHLAAKPRVNLRSIGRRQYARLSTEQDEIQVDANRPLGEDALFTLEFRKGRYAIHACNGHYLKADGKLTKQCECLFGLEFHGGYLALRDPQGRYVSPIGNKAVLRAQSSTVTKDELFSLEDSIPQAALAGFNGKHVSAKQVGEIANLDDLEQDMTRTTLVKSKRGFGLVLMAGTEQLRDFLQIKKIVPHLPAWYNGKIKVGDILIFLNEKCIIGYSVMKAMSLFNAIEPGEIVQLGLAAEFKLPDLSNPVLSAPSSEKDNYGSLNKKNMSTKILTPLLQSIALLSLGQINFPVEIEKDKKKPGFVIDDSFCGEKIVEDYSHKVVTLSHLENENLGFFLVKTIKTDDLTIGPIKIGSPADKCGQLHEGDRIFAVNNVSVKNMKLEDIIILIKKSGYQVTLTIGKKNSRKSNSNTTSLKRKDVIDITFETKKTL